MRAFVVGFFMSIAAFIHAWTGFSVTQHAVPPPATEVPIVQGFTITSGVTATSSPRIASVSSMSEKTVAKKDMPIVSQPPVVILPPLPRSVPAPASAPAIPPPATTSAPVPIPAPTPLLKPSLLPLDIASIYEAVVKIECPSEDRKGKYVGSGFVLSGNQENGISIVTAAHLLMVSGSDTCTIIFPDKDRRPAHWFTGTIRESKDVIARRHDEEGIDVALITLPRLDDYPEARAVFPEKYPAVPYPVCTDPDMIGDALYHFGYPSNFLNQSYLSKADGTAIAYADISGIETLLNESQTAAYKSPIFSYVTDKYHLHPYMVSRVATFYGDSGGLAFNATKQCMLGPQRGGTIGGGAGENVSIFPILAWPRAQSLLP